MHICVANGRSTVHNGSQDLDFGVLSEAVDDQAERKTLRHDGTANLFFADRLDAYDPQNGSRVTRLNVNLSRTVDRVQGGAFSTVGHVYLASDARSRLGEPKVEGIHAFGLLNGRYLGHLFVPARAGWPYLEEIEGIGIGAMNVDGRPTQVHLVFLDKDILGRDDVYLKSYEVPDPAIL